MSTVTAWKVLLENEAEMTGLEKALLQIVLDLQSRVIDLEQKQERAK